MRSVLYVRGLLLAIVFSVAGLALAAEPTLEIDIGSSAQRLTRTALLANPALRTVTVSADAAYKRSMQYRALPLLALIGKQASEGNLQFTATDGFVANIPMVLLNGAGQAWLAIEPADAHWPALKPGGPSAGPFYLVWLSPDKAGISPEQWPYQIAKISLSLSLDKHYPQIVPHPATSTGIEQRGLHVYMANCASCHPMNGGGDAKVGPDLNLPANPTEYFHEAYLRKLIRNPASVRTWGQSIMPGFAVTALSDAQLDDLLAYLRQMAKQRQ